MPLEFKDVSFVYGPKTPYRFVALDHVSFTLPDGVFAAIVGKTGSGKSTLVQLCNALLSPSEGTVLMNDFVNAPKTRKKAKAIKNLRKRVGLVFQFPEYQLFEDSVEKDVAFGPRNFGLSKEEALKKAHEALRFIGLPPTFDKRSPFELSGGEKRKVAMAGILALEPDVLIVDEPTSGLDPQAAEETMALFKDVRKRKGSSIYFVTHDMDLVLEYAETVLVLENGQLVRHSSPKDLFGEDLSCYSLDNPKVFDFAMRLNRRGFLLNRRSIETVDSLAEEIAVRYKERGRG